MVTYSLCNVLHMRYSLLWRWHIVGERSHRCHFCTNREFKRRITPTLLANVAITYEQRILHVSIACTGAYRLQHDVDHIHVIRNLYGLQLHKQCSYKKYR